MRGFFRRHWTWTAAAVAAAANLSITLYGQVLTPQAHGSLDIATLLVIFWAITRHYSGPRLKPGELIVTRDQLRHLEESVREAWASVQDGGAAAPEPALRVVKPGA